MSKKVLVNIDLAGNELQNAVVQPLATKPVNGKVGQIYYDTVTKKLMQHDGEDFKPLSMTSAEIVQAINAGTVKLEKSSIEGLQEMIESVQMSGADIKDQINKDSSGKKIQADQVGLDDYLKTADLTGHLEAYATNESVTGAKGTAISESKSYTDNKIKELVGAADAAHDTFGELQTILASYDQQLQHLNAIDNVAKKYSTFIGDGTATEIAINHNLNTEDVVINLIEVATKEVVVVDCKVVDANTIKVITKEPLASQAYKIVVVG
ncbi:hypothetical protein [Aerococcus christensenii]|uniref:hypothetical protein n=1 Tax=Aerococcus christensenii TaxID=87541 RepID=UPI0020638BAF|nr:MAG TPA: hypothetical protein [Caudoviricetes sp.]